MEIKLNKIRTDINEKLQEETRTDKVHSNDNKVKVKTDIKQKEDGKKETKNTNKTKKRIIIDGYKYRNESLKVEVEKNKVMYDEDKKGNILDIKK